MLKRGRRVLRSLAIPALASLVAACSLQNDVASAPPSGRIGVPAPALSGSTLDGKSLTVSFRDRKTVLIFWASWCGPCRKEQPGLNQMANDLASKGVHFMGIDFLDHDRAAATAFVQEFHVPYPSLFDDPGQLAALYQVDAPPATILVNGKGTVIARVPGEISQDKLERLIQAKLLAP